MSYLSIALYYTSTSKPLVRLFSEKIRHLRLKNLKQVLNVG